MAMSTRRLHHHNLQDNISKYDYGDDLKDNKQQHQPRTVLGNYKPPNNKTSNMKESHAVLDALSDGNSQLAKFLFVGSNKEETQDDVNDNINQRRRKRRVSWFTSNDTTNIQEDMKSMGSWNALWFALALEPMHIRNERIIMLFEAYTIFGALFFNVIWIIYEWASYKGYGGEVIYERHNRIFECIMAVAFACNLFLALFSAYFWLFSITANSSQDDYVYRNLTSLTYCFALLVFTVTLNTAGFLMGVYSNLSPNKPEIVISMIISIIIFLAGNLVIRKQQLECTPLECYHAPRFIKIAYPFLWPITRKGKEELKVNAKLRADQLKKRAYHERKKLDPDFDLRQNKTSTTSSSVGDLLRTAAINLGRYDSDLSNYEARLEAEWLTIETMKGRSVDCLSKYMPLVLAEEVHRILVSDVNINDTS